MAPSSGHCACCRYHRRKAEGPHRSAVHDSLFYIQTRLCTLQLNSVERAPRVLSRHLRVRARALGPAWAPRGRHWGAPGGRRPCAHLTSPPCPGRFQNLHRQPLSLQTTALSGSGRGQQGAGQVVALRTRQAQANPPEGPRGQGARCPGCWGPPASAPAVRRSTPTGRTRPR